MTTAADIRKYQEDLQNTEVDNIISNIKDKINSDPFTTSYIVSENLVSSNILEALTYLGFKISEYYNDGMSEIFYMITWD